MRGHLLFGLALLSAGCDPAVRGRIDSKDPDERRTAMANSVGTDDKTWVGIFLKALKDEDPLVRGQAVRCLGRTFRRDLADTLLPMLTGEGRDPSAQVRVDLCHAVGQLGNPKAIAVLLGVMERDPEMDVRKAACRQVGRFRAKEIYEAWARGIDDPDPGFSHLCSQHLRFATGRRDAPRSRAEWETWIAANPDAWKRADTKLR